MNTYIDTLKRVVMLLLVAALVSAGILNANAQGKGRGKGESVRPEIMRPGQPVKADLAKPIPRPKLVKVAKPTKPPKPFKPAKRPKRDRHAHKRCVKACDRAHKAAVRACRDRRGRDRAACERAANEAHRSCVQGCPR